MALPDYEAISLGTAVIWGEAGASGVTKTLTFEALASAAARMGASADLGAAWDDEQVLEVRVETGTAPTAGTTVEVYLAWSSDNTNWPAKITGSDAAFPDTAATDDGVATNKLLLGPPACVLVATGDGNLTLKQNPVIVRAVARYVVPVIVNLLGQAFRDEATATNNDGRIVLTPRRRGIQDS
jgi:hypothetical protein